MADQVVQDPAFTQSLLTVLHLRHIVTHTSVTVDRRLLRTGNYELSQTHFRWIDDFVIADEGLVDDAWKLERTEWGVFFGQPVAMLIDDQVVAEDAVEGKIRQMAQSDS